MTAARVALALVATTAASITAITGHHHKHPATASGTLADVYPLSPRASRSHVRDPLPAHVKTPRARQRPRPHLVAAVQQSGGGIYADVTMYCATGSRNADGRWPELGDVAVMDRTIPFGTHVLVDGNTYTVRDWIGSGSQFDIYGGADGCEQRAVNFGRRHLRVVVER